MEVSTLAIMVKTRYAAFGIHLAISFVLFILLASIIRFFWYPGILFSTEGGWEGIKLIARLLIFRCVLPEL